MAFSKVVYFEETVCLGVKVSVQRVMEGTSAVLYWPGCSILILSRAGGIK